MGQQHAFWIHVLILWPRGMCSVSVGVSNRVMYLGDSILRGSSYIMF